MVGTISIAESAKNPNLPLPPIFTFTDAPSNIRLINAPKKIGEWQITSVRVSVVYPDGSNLSSPCTLIGGCWSTTFSGCQTTGKVTNGATVFADGVDENGDNVTDYVLGKGDVVVLEGGMEVSPDEEQVAFMRLCSTTPTNPTEGAVVNDEGWMVYTSSGWQQIGVTMAEVQAYVTPLLADKQNALSNNQISAIDSVVDERKTYITLYDDGSILEFDWSGEVNQQTMVDADLYDATVDVWKRPIAKIKFGNTVTSIGENTFNRAVTLYEVLMSDSITSIGNNAFVDCASVEFDKLPNNLTSIGTAAFENCSSIKYMSIPSGVRTIGPYAFHGCYQMTHVTIPNNVRTIGQHAFDGCRYLEGITIPETVTSIGPYAFFDCTDLRNVTICSDSLVIGRSAFEACTMLANVIFKL